LLVATLPGEESVILAQPLGLAKIHFAPLVQASDDIHCPMLQARHGGVFSIGPITHENVSTLEAVPQLAEEPEIMHVKIAGENVQNSSTGQGEKHCQLHHRKATPLLLSRGLRILQLILWSVGQLSGRAVHDLNGATLEAAASTGPAISGGGGGLPDFFQTLLRHALACLHVGRGAFVDWSMAQQAAQGLDVANYFTAGGAWIEHLPDKAFASQPQGERTVPAIGSVVFAGQEVDGDEFAEVLPKLKQCGLAQALN
jgi:hypothetical protein